MTRARTCFLVLLWLVAAGRPSAVRADDVLHVYVSPDIFAGAQLMPGDQTFSTVDGWTFTPYMQVSTDAVVFDLIQGNGATLAQQHRLEFLGPGASFYMPGASLTVGDYPDAGSTSVAADLTLTPGKPAVDFDALNYADNQFEVLDVAYDPASGVVTRLAANFVERDITKAARVVYGQIRYHSDVPVNAGQTYVFFDQAAYAVNEGDGAVTITVDRQGGSADAVSVHYTTGGGTAVAGVNYTTVSGTLTWAAGDTSPRTFVLPLLENNLVQGVQTVHLRLTGNGIGTPAHAIVTIADDDAPPAASLLHYHTYGADIHGNPPQDLTFTPADGYAFTELATAGTLLPMIDVEAVEPATVPFGEPGFYSLGFNIPSHTLLVGSYTSQGGSKLEFDPILSYLKVASTGFQILEVNYGGDGTLLQLAVNFDGLDASGQPVLLGELRYHSTVALRGTVTLVSDTFRGKKSGPGLVVTVDRAGDPSEASSVKYTTTAYSAVAGVDYAATSGELKWAAGDTSPKTYTVPILHDPASGDRILFTTLEGDSLGSIATATLTIVDDSLPAAASLPEPNGQIDRTYPVGLSNSTTVTINALRPRADGSTLVGGNFGAVDGHTQPGILLLDAQGLYDPTFTSPLILAQDQSVAAIAIQPDGKVLAAGFFTLAGGQKASILRLNTDGSLDAAFHADPKIDAAVNYLALQPDGRVVLAGAFQQGSGLARLNADGSLDASFAPPLVNYLLQGTFVVLQPDGKLIVGNDYGSVKRLNVDGSVDASYSANTGSSASLYTNAVVLQPDGKLIVPTGGEGNQLTRFLRDGTVDPDFTLDASLADRIEDIRSLALQPDGKLLVGLQPDETTGSGALNGLIRLNVDGSVDPGFQLQAGLPPVVGALALEPDGSLLLSSGETVDGTDVVHTVFARLTGAVTVVVTPVVTVAVQTPKAVRSSGQDGEFIVARAGGDLSQPLVVEYKVVGNAAAGTDYAALTGRQKIKAGHSTAAVRVSPLAGSTGRGTRTVKLVVQGTEDYVVGDAAVGKVKVVDQP